MNKKVECITRFIHLSSSIDNIKSFLVDEKIVNEETFVPVNTIQAFAELIYLVLSKALQEDKITLVDYEWTLLPKEQIKITIVTPTAHKIFSYGL